MRQVSKSFSLYYILAIVFYTKSLAIIFFKKKQTKKIRVSEEYVKVTLFTL